MSIKIEKEMSLTIGGKEDLYMLRDLISLGQDRLNEVNEDAWGDKIQKTRDFGDKLRTIISDFQRLGLHDV